MLKVINGSLGFIGDLFETHPRLANENPRWGYGKIEGEMLKAERWVRAVREECLDHILILNGTHLRSVLHEYVEGYYNVARPHQGIGQGIPLPR